MNGAKRLPMKRHDPDQRSPDLRSAAMAIGATWAREIVRALRDDEREIVGAWPGTISEAKVRLLAQLEQARDIDVLTDLARVATVAARHEWHRVAVHDPARSET